MGLIMNLRTKLSIFAMLAYLSTTTALGQTVNGLSEVDPSDISLWNDGDSRVNTLSGNDFNREGKMRQSTWRALKNEIGKIYSDLQNTSTEGFDQNLYDQARRDFEETRIACMNAEKDYPSLSAKVYQEYYIAYARLMILSNLKDTPETIKTKYDDEREFEHTLDLLIGCPQAVADPESDKYFETLLSFGQTSLSFAETPGFGTQISSSGIENLVLDIEALYADDNGETIDLGITRIPFDDDRFALGGIRHYELDASGAKSVTSGTVDVAMTYHDFSPGGSTGIFLGPRGLDVFVDLDYTSTELYGGYSPGEIADTVIPWYFRLDYEREETDIRADVTTPSFSDISSSSEQNLKSDSIAFGVGIQPILFDANNVSFQLDANMGIGYFNAELESRQTNICGLCPASDQNFTIDIKDEKSGEYVSAHASIDVSYELITNFHIGFFADVDFQSHAPTIFNPRNGDDLFLDNRSVQIEETERTRQTFGIITRFYFY